MARFLPLDVPACLALGLTSLAGCNQLGLSGSGGGGTCDAGTLGSVCGSNAGSCGDGLECCLAFGAACTGDYDCCGGLCSGGACAASDITACKAALGSRCTSVESCACTTSDDCCQENTGAVCSNSVVTTAGMRCCLTTGTPCGGDGDCCSGSCGGNTAGVCD